MVHAETSGCAPARILGEGMAKINVPPVVAITGLAGHGKSEIAKYLVNRRGYTRVKFAHTIKAMLRLLGLSDAHIEGSLKEVPCPQLGGKSPRHAMITLGTEWGRDLIWSDLWVADWEARACDVLAVGGKVVVDDLRFPNEREYVGRLGALVMRVTRPGCGEAGQHESESYVATMPVHVEIANSGTVADLRSLVDAHLRAEAAA